MTAAELLDFDDQLDQLAVARPEALGEARELLVRCLQAGLPVPGLGTYSSDVVVEWKGHFYGWAMVTVPGDGRWLCDSAVSLNDTGSRWDVRELETTNVKEAVGFISAAFSQALQIGAGS